MTGHLLRYSKFVEKYLGTVRFGNDQFAPILGYGDLVQGNITINRVYYVEGLNHNLFSVGQFCDADYWKNRLHSLHLLMAKASPTQAWLWHQRLSHLNFDYINFFALSNKDVEIGFTKTENGVVRRDEPHSSVEAASERCLRLLNFPLFLGHSSFNGQKTLNKHLSNPCLRSPTQKASDNDNPRPSAPEIQNVSPSADTTLLSR
ncbi:hypothetical protein Tco_0006168 [Tanacetum coccineum]